MNIIMKTLCLVAASAAAAFFAVHHQLEEPNVSLSSSKVVHVIVGTSRGPDSKLSEQPPNKYPVNSLRDRHVQTVVAAKPNTKPVADTSSSELMDLPGGTTSSTDNLYLVTDTNEQVESEERPSYLLPRSTHRRRRLQESGSYPSSLPSSSQPSSSSPSSAPTATANPSVSSSNDDPSSVTALSAWLIFISFTTIGSCFAVTNCLFRCYKLYVKLRQRNEQWGHTTTDDEERTTCCFSTRSFPLEELSDFSGDENDPPKEAIEDDGGISSSR